MGKRLPYDEKVCGAANPGIQTRHSLTHFVAAVEHNPMTAIQSMDRDGIVQLWNSASAELYGISAHDALGKPMSDLMVHHGAENVFAVAVKQIWDSGQPGMANQYRHRAGSMGLLDLVPSA